MRLWSIHPQYLDRQGLVACWSEGLLAKSVLLQGEYKAIDCDKCRGKGWLSNLVGGRECLKCNMKGYIKIKTPYYNHPQLIRFKKKPIESLKNYLYYIFEEASKRGYNFNATKIQLKHEDWIVDCPKEEYFMTVTKGQLQYELRHLLRKLWTRDIDQFNKTCNMVGGHIDFEHYNPKHIEPYPLFKVVEGDIETWEKIK